MPKKKYPDNVVHSEEKGFYASTLEYGSNVGAPAINIVDIATWKQVKSNSANDYFKTKFDELKQEYQKLINEFKWNELVYSATYNFQPIMGEPYYLYENDGKIFLSLIAPDEWGKNWDHLIYIGTFTLDSQNKWTKNAEEV